MAAVIADPGWEARLRLVFATGGERTRLVERERRGPLGVQRPFYPEGDVCHVYLLHPPGGAVGGDRIDLDVRALPGSRALVTTPGAGKYYRSAGPRVEQQCLVGVGAHSSIEFLPQENIYFPGARVRARSRFELGADARLLAWEIHCLGLPARGERFANGEIDSALEVWRDGEPLLLERLRVTGEAPGRGAGLRGFAVSATLLAAPADGELCRQLHEWLPAEPATALGTTLLEDLLVVRCLGTSTSAVKRSFTRIWQRLRPAVSGRAALLPRVWAT